MKKAVSYLAIVIFAVLLLSYSKYGSLQAVKSPLEEELFYTTEGFEEPEEAVTYFLYQVQQNNMDGALRVCAISDLAEYFSLTNFIEYTGQFSGISMLPPAEMENKAYIEISRMRLAYKYGLLFQKEYNALAHGQQMKILDVRKIEPENPDGMYYENRKAISQIMGAREVAEVCAYVQTDEQIQELHFSLARYKKYWKMILCNDLEKWHDPKPAILLVEEKSDFDAAGVALDGMDEIILPPNYYILTPQKADTKEILASDFFLYLQRGDTLSAISFFYHPGETDAVSVLETLRLQKEAAIRLQKMYYGMLLYDQQTVEWAERHYSDEPDAIPKLLDTKNMIFSSYSGVDNLIEDGNYSAIKINYGYADQWYSVILNLINRDGWYIDSFSSQE